MIYMFLSESFITSIVINVIRLQTQLTHPFYGFFDYYQEEEDLYVLQREVCVMFCYLKKLLQLFLHFPSLFFCLLFWWARRKVSSYFAIIFEKWLYMTSSYCRIVSNEFYLIKWFCSLSEIFQQPVFVFKYLGTLQAHYSHIYIIFHKNFTLHNI